MQTNTDTSPRVSNLSNFYNISGAAAAVVIWKDLIASPLVARKLKVADSFISTLSLLHFAQNSSHVWLAGIEVLWGQVERIADQRNRGRAVSLAGELCLIQHIQPSSSHQLLQLETLCSNSKSEIHMRVRWSPEVFGPGLCRCVICIDVCSSSLRVLIVMCTV